MVNNLCANANFGPAHQSGGSGFQWTVSMRANPVSPGRGKGSEKKGRDRVRRRETKG